MPYSVHVHEQHAGKILREGNIMTSSHNTRNRARNAQPGTYTMYGHPHCHCIINSCKWMNTAVCSLCSNSRWCKTNPAGICLQQPARKLMLHTLLAC